MASPSAMTQGDPQTVLAGAVAQIVGEIFRDPERRAQSMGEAFLAGSEAAAEHPAEFERAMAEGCLREFIEPAVSQRLRSSASDRPEHFTGGWLGVFIDADGRPVESAESSGLDPAALEVGQQALTRAVSLAELEGNRTLARNLGWYRSRLEHQSYDAIAAREGKPLATIRTGVARARKVLLRIVHELNQAQPSPLNGDAPAAIAPLRDLWTRQDLDGLACALEKTRDAYGGDPHWLNLAGLLAADRGRFNEARNLYERGLVGADAPSVRGRILNNLGNLADEEGEMEEATNLWLRANQLVPDAPTPLMNLLAAASEARDYPSAQHFIALLGDQQNSGRLTQQDRRYIERRLRENPKYRWLRTTDAWRKGPGRWVAQGASRARLQKLGAQVIALLAAAFVLSGLGGVSTGPAAPTGDSKLELASGDSMGRSDGDRRPGGRTRHA